MTLARALRSLLVAALLPLVAVAPAWAQDVVRVADRAGLEAALAAASGGETILLGDGDYGELILSGGFEAPVTLRSERHLGARFARLGLSGGSGFAFEGMTITEGLPIVEGSSRVAIRAVDLTGNLYVRGASEVVIEDSRIHDGQFGVVLNTVNGFLVRHNSISRATEDLVRVTGGSSGILEYNFIHDPNTAAGHPDCIQLFASRAGEAPHDVVIRGNHLYAVADGEGGRYDGAQGIFLSDARTAGGFRNILIEDNLIKVQFANALYIDGGQENVVVRNNTVLPNDGDGGGFIRLAKKSGFDNSGTIVEGNIAKMIIDETHTSRLLDNYWYGRDAPLSWIFADAEGNDWRGFVPVPRTRIDFGSGFGAEAFLADLLAGRARIGPSWAPR